MMKTKQIVSALISAVLVAGCTQVQPVQDSASRTQSSPAPRSETKPVAAAARPPAQPEDDHYARGIVIQALTMPNKLGVGGREFRTKPNPKGEGVFVYDPRTEFAGVQRNLIWLIVKNTAYALNGPSKTLTPSLKWPREADQAIWRTTSLDPHAATEAIEIVFGSR